MIRNFLWLAALSIICTAVAAASYQLEEVWSTDPTLQVPECVLFNPADGKLYVSNISGKPLEKNGRGFISIVDLDGKIINLKWATGLHAPKGMAIEGNSLYVTDIDALVQIDLDSGNIIKRYPAEGAVFMNDVAADAEGRIYAGDSSAAHGMLYRLHDGSLDPWLMTPALGSPNGLLMQDDRLLAGDARNGKLYSIDPETKEVSVITQTDTGIDGLKSDGKGNYITSNWKGRTALITAGGKTVVLMDTTAAGIYAADLEYLTDRKLLLIPTFFDNRVVAYKLTEKKTK